MIFVFGSNLAGRHGRGAAFTASRQYGAAYGVGTGRTGNAYAIPTKDESLRPLALPVIKYYVRQFIYYAQRHPEEQFFVTAIGTGLAGYTREQIEPMFAGAPDNCILPEGWQR